MKKIKTINIFLVLVFVIGLFVLSGCSEKVNVTYEDSSIEQTNTQNEKTQENAEKTETQKADEVEEVGDLLNMTEVDNRTKTITYNGENITLNIPDIQWVTLRNLELRERAVLNNRENHLATAIGSIKNTGNVDDSVIVVVRLYGKTFVNDVMYHVLEVEGRKTISVPANSQIDFKFDIDYEDREWFGYSFSFE